MKVGTLDVIDADGRTHRFGPGGEPTAILRLHDRTVARDIALDPALRLGESYMDGRIDFGDPGLRAFMDLITLNLGWTDGEPFMRAIAAIRQFGRRLAQFNPIQRAVRNVAHHYDLSDQLYDLFLDPDRQYSCAYFEHPEDSLERAQAQKKRHIAAKLLLQPGQRVIDIGSGWGGLAIYLAQVADVEVTGVTLSREQHKYSNERAQALGLADRVRFEFRDFRLVEEQFDRIVSVGMFEHVGVNHYPAFFRKCRSLLKPDGVGLVHSIGRADGPGHTNAWIRKYIFPGGYSPALSEVIPVVEREALIATDIEILRLHYAQTLERWQQRFAANRDRVAEIYDERFCRMWEFYLVGSEMAFRHGGHMNFQLQFARHQEAVPRTRDYMGEWERAHPIDVPDSAAAAAE
nr:cyclopropane-fatty-acyl-phospholipid synthase family protein [Oceanibacterium hippocampi]